jgi:peptidoglycan/LPS O-acetylase OafA/YrhL
MNDTTTDVSPDAVTYRPDIDGLRGLAVLAVVAFHMHAGLLPGGYVGVDVFFVISGFLITSIILRNLQQSAFSFFEFYIRRAKRIFPALILVLLAVLAIGWIFLLPGEYRFLGKHVAAGAGFISNFALWQESGYFDRAAESKPLLHLWSLGIEEQFYLLWPPLLVWAWRRRIDALSIAAGIVAGSFAINLFLLSRLEPSDAYYLSFARFWELLLGCVSRGRFRTMNNLFPNRADA